jgi:hypothetical protein
MKSTVHPGEGMHGTERLRPTRSRLAGALMLLALSTSACDSSMNTPDIKRNPHPKIRYEITLTIHDAPGPFDAVSGHVQYEVADERCSPENTYTGTWNPPHAREPFALSQVDDHSYSGTVYLDLLQDEDYYDLGVCHWRAAFAVADMKVEDVTFSTSVSSNDMTAQRPSTEYLWKQAYMGPASDDGSGNSVPLIEAVKRNPERYFSATLTARAAF